MTCVMGTESWGKTDACLPRRMTYASSRGARSPLPQAGEGSKHAVRDAPAPRTIRIHPMAPTLLTQPKGNP
ncbi:hypothetical protein CBM2592_A260076 [Cupriavidus taiwanensis]|nr:hypothetical protein CBM2592_A260076 [Cupriavidus taiwanensis]SOY51971.1 hypothetical protein CBM2588_A210076 [Cupriavidus taiwanensis]SOY84386.1 hypothetical protein CBM2591_A300077 [Cupriavidus taiwanensis]SOZ59005.1 hypothetical protein CBM2617_A300076 [Cupriavidus taiwanensis]SOZ80149.1 hypothetical protein CBM2618_A270077 [Cupriavidus taiwanensis]